MTAKKPSVGAAIEAWCTKCKDDKPHVVESLKKDGNIWKVRCDVCDGSHLYRLPKGPDGAKKKSPSKSKTKKTKAPNVTEAEAANAKDYVVGGDFSVGDVIRHARFGLGKVAEVRPGGKMVVAFDEGPRLLLCRDIPTVGKRRVVARPPVAPVAPEPASDDDSSDDSSDDLAVDDDADGDDAVLPTDDAEE